MRLGAAAALLGLAACAPAAAAPASPAARGGAPLDPALAELERFLPLHDGHVLSYRVWLGNAGTPEQVIFQVERHSPARASLRAGSHVRQLEIGVKGVRLVTGGYLLVPPLERGAEWTGAAGPVQLSATGVAVKVPAGHFEGCLETLERDTRGPLERRILTSYCPDVGIARIEVDDGERLERFDVCCFTYVHSRFELLSFGPRVDVDAL